MDPLAFRERYPPEIREWWEKVLKNPRYIVAPMVDASELPWRMLSRRYKADLCFTPMLHSKIFSQDVKYQAEHLYNCVAPEDRPLIVQFCGNDPTFLVKAATLAKPYCDGIDINLGCPQKIASAGHYGAFLMEEWDLIAEIVKRIRNEVKVPVSCKIRIFPDINKTVEYAKMLEKAGCYMITVHGRTRQQKGMDTGIANWEYIKAVRNAVNIPVVANGNIQYLSDVERCILETGVEGVMSAEGNLNNPKIFAGDNPPIWEMAMEYLELVKKYPCPLSYSRGHLFKMYHHVFALPENSDLRNTLGNTNTLDALLDVTVQLKSRYEKYTKGDIAWEFPEPAKTLALPPFMCQPYVRPPKKEEGTDVIGLLDLSERKGKRKITLPDSILASLPPGTQLSKKKIKKMSKYPDRNWCKERTPVILCSCANPVGTKCTFKLCRSCCKSKCYNETVNCEGHKIFKSAARESKKLKTDCPVKTS